MRSLLPVLFAAVLAASCTRTPRVLTQEELQDRYLSADLYPAGTYFWDEFGKYRDRYNLTEEESMLLGEWTDFNIDLFKTFYSYWFFPNRLFICSADWKYKDDPDRAIENVLGIWFIRDNAVYARIFGLNEVSGRTGGMHDSGAKHKYILVEPYERKIVELGEIQSTGYTRNHFNPVEPPNRFKDRLVISRPSGKELREDLKDGVGMVRTLYVVYVIPDIHYIFGLFSLVPRFAKDDVSGLDIVTDPALVEKYFVRSLSFPYEDYSRREEWDR